MKITIEILGVADIKKNLDAQHLAIIEEECAGGENAQVLKDTLSILKAIQKQLTK